MSGFTCLVCLIPLLATAAEGPPRGLLRLPADNISFAVPDVQCGPAAEADIAIVTAKLVAELRIPVRVRENGRSLHDVSPNATLNIPTQGGFIPAGTIRRIALALAGSADRISDRNRDTPPSSPEASLHAAFIPIHGPAEVVVPDLVRLRVEFGPRSSSSPDTILDILVAPDGRVLYGDGAGERLWEVGHTARGDDGTWSLDLVEWQGRHAETGRVHEWRWDPAVDRIDKLRIREKVDLLREVNDYFDGTYHGGKDARPAGR